MRIIKLLLVAITIAYTNNCFCQFNPGLFPHKIESEYNHYTLDYNNFSTTKSLTPLKIIPNISKIGEREFNRKGQLTKTSSIDFHSKSLIELYIEYNSEGLPFNRKLYIEGTWCAEDNITYNDNHQILSYTLNYFKGQKKDDSGEYIVVSYSEPKVSSFYYTYDNMGRLLHITDPKQKGKLLAITYNSKGLITTVHDEYSSDGRVNKLSLISYDSLNRIISRDRYNCIGEYYCSNYFNQLFTYSEDGRTQFTLTILPHKYVYNSTFNYYYDAEEYGNNRINSSFMYFDFDSKESLEKFYPLYLNFSDNSKIFLTYISDNEDGIMEYSSGKYIDMTFDEQRAWTYRKMPEGQVAFGINCDNSNVIEEKVNHNGQLISENSGNGYYSKYEYDEKGRLMHSIHFSPKEGTREYLKKYNQYDRLVEEITIRTATDGTVEKEVRKISFEYY